MAELKENHENRAFPDMRYAHSGDAIFLSAHQKLKDCALRAFGVF